MNQMKIQLRQVSTSTSEATLRNHHVLNPSRDAFERLVEIADRGCIMMNTLRGKLDVRIRVGVTI